MGPSFLGVSCILGLGLVWVRFRFMFRISVSKCNGGRVSFGIILRVIGLAFAWAQYLTKMIPYLTLIISKRVE